MGSIRPVFSLHRKSHMLLELPLLQPQSCGLLILDALRCGLEVILLLPPRVEHLHGVQCKSEFRQPGFDQANAGCVSRPRTCRDGLSVTAVVGGPTSCEQADLVAHEDASQGALGCLQLAGIHLDADHGSALLLAAAERLFGEGAEPEVGGRTYASGRL